MELFITDYCLIRNNQVLLNHHLLAESGVEEIQERANDWYAQLGVSYPRFYKMNLLSRLGLLASEVLLKNVRLVDASLTGLVISNASSSLASDVEYFHSMATIPSPSLFVYTLPNIISGEICIRHKLKGENTFFVFDHFEPETLTFYVRQLMERNAATDCVSGWVDLRQGQPDVFLYLVRKVKGNVGISHTADNLLKLYISA